MITDLITLERPLIALDVETHDLCPPEQAYIVELGFVKISPGVPEPKKWVTYIKPDLPITKEATHVHGITNELVASAPRFNQLAANLNKGFSGSDFCGYNIRFDLRVLQTDMARAGINWSSKDVRMLDALQLWRVAMPRTLSHAVEEFLKRKPTEAHRALGDAEDALAVAEAQLRRFQQLPRDIQLLHDLCFSSNNVDPDGKFIWKDGVVVCNFGKWSKTPLAQLPKSYCEWIVKSDFTPDVKELVQNALNGILPVKGGI